MVNSSRFFLFALSFLLPTLSIAQKKPMLKQQINLGNVNHVTPGGKKQNTFLSKSGDTYTLIDQASKIQLGSLQLDIDGYSLPGIGQACVWSDSTYLISSGSELLEVDVVQKKIDTLFKAVTFPEFIINFMPVPGNEKLLLIAAKTYPATKDGEVAFSNKKGEYDDSKNCRLILYDTRTKKTVRSISTPYAITVFADEKFNNKFLAGTFGGDVIEIDSALVTNVLFHPFDRPVYSVTHKQLQLIAVPHIAPKYIGDSGAGTMYFYDTTTKQIKELVLPDQKPVVRDEFGMNPAPSNQISRIFPAANDNSLFVSYGFSRLLKLSLPVMDTVSLPVAYNAANFYCFNKDSTQLLAAVADYPGIFLLAGKLTMYDLQRKKFQSSFAEAAEKEKYSGLYKLFDKDGNYHFLGLRSKSYQDTLVIYSSNRTAPTLLIYENGDIAINPKDTTITFIRGGIPAIYGRLHLEKLREQQYVFSFGYREDGKDKLNPEIFTMLLDTRKIPDTTIPFGISDVYELNNRSKLVVGGYPIKNTHKYWIRVIDSAGKLAFSVPDFDRGIEPEFCKPAPSLNRIAFYREKNGVNILEAWDIVNNKKLFEKTFSRKTDLQYFEFDKTKDVLWYAQYTLDKPIEIFKADLTAATVTASFVFAEHGFLSFQVDMDKDLIASENYSYLALHRISDKKLLWELYPATSHFKVYNLPDGYGFASEEEYHVIKTNLNYLYFTAFDGHKPIEILNNHLYKGDKAAINNLAFILNRKGYSPADYDMYFNRPDSVLIQSGSTNTAFNQLIGKTVEKRIRYYPVKSMEALLTNAPLFAVVNKNSIADVVSEPTLKLTLKTQSVSGKPVTAVHVISNGVPVYGSKGFAVSTSNPELTIPLVKNSNNLQLYVTDADGYISSSENIRVVAEFTTPAPKTYFIGIGIDRFANSRYNLQYSSKDIRDLTIKLKEKYGAALIIDTLFNENVTINNVKALKNKLQQTGVNDKVIISYSGHGLLSKTYDYYLSTYGVNFQNPGENGLAYDALEDLLDGIPAREKLMLIDACHSGEVDKEELANLKKAEGNLAATGVTAESKGIELLIDDKKAGMQNSFELMQQLFINVSRSTGATVISAAAGTQFALEKNDLKNGVFSYSILEFMQTNQHAKVSDLKQYVNKRVVELTAGLQVPTTRNETNLMDWLVW